MPKYNVPTKSKVQIRKNTKPETYHGEKQEDTGGNMGHRGFIKEDYTKKYIN